MRKSPKIERKAKQKRMTDDILDLMDEREDKKEIKRNTNDFINRLCHVGIPGNEKADRLAKAALTSSLAAQSQVCWADLKPRVDTYICTAWQALWNNETRNKLYEIRPNLKESLCNTTQPLYRKQETVMTRLRIGHTWITHSYLLKKEDQPFCHACDNPFTVKHILVECLHFTHIRNKYYTTTDVHTLFREVDSSKITEYLKEIKLFDKI